MRNSSVLWEQFGTQRDRIINNLKHKLFTNMASLIGHAETADLILVASDGHKLPAHICILRQRAPVFFNRHIDPILNGPKSTRHRRLGEPLEVAIKDVDSAGLGFFIRSVYTDEEIRNLESENDTAKESTSTDKKDDDPDPSNFEVDDEYDQSYTNRSQERGDATPRNNGETDSLDRTPGAYQEEAEYAVPVAQDHDSGFHQSSSIEKPSTDEPIMTSFRELASDSPMCLSGYSERSQYDIAEEDEHEVASEAQSYGSHGRFVHLEDSGIASSQMESPRKKKSTKIFPMFIGFGSSNQLDCDMTQSLPSAALSSSPYSSTQTLSAGSIRGRAMLARRLSVTSLTSLTSIDLTPTTENVTPIGDKLPCSQLGADLLEMYQKSIDTDTVIVTDGGDLHAHKCILWATCSTFRKTLKTSTKVELRGFSRNAVDFFLCFLYAGLTCIPEDVEVWEVVALATHLNIEELAQVAALHLKTQKCHFFHRPCATCVSAVFDALPQFRSIRSLNPLFEEAMAWQARNFSRIWKGRVFLHLDEQWQHECRDALINEINEEFLIDTLLGCEKLQVSLPRIKSQQLADSVQSLVSDVVEYCMEFLSSSFDLVLGSKAFKSHGKGLALNLALMEDLFPPLIHSLSADTAIRAFIALRDLLIEIQQNEKDLEQSPKRSFLHIPIDDWNPRFIHLCRRLFESIDKHLLHYAFSVVKSEAYSLLSEDERERIEEAGIFVEMKMPKAPPPKLSSFNRTYKRSSSVGLGVNGAGRHDRTRSLERSRPIISQVIEASEKEEMAREKSFIEIHRRANSMKNQPESSRQLSKPSPSKPTETVPKPVEPATTEKVVITSRNPSPASKIPAPTASIAKRERSVSPSNVPKPTEVGPRTPKKGPPPVKRPVKMVINPEELMLERENTRTIITKEQHKEMGVDPREMGVPQVGESPKIKPKSVVRPMPKTPSLAASTPIPSISHQAGKELVTRTKSNTTKTGSTSSNAVSANITPSSQQPRPRPKSSLPTRQTASSAARAAAATKRVESKIPKVRA